MQLEQLQFEFMKDFNSEGKNEREHKISGTAETVCNRESDKPCIQENS